MNANAAPAAPLIPAHTMILDEARISFPVLFTPQRMAGGIGNPAWSATFLIPPDSPLIAKCRAEILKVATGKWKADAEKQLKMLYAKNMVCLRDGDQKANYEGYAGNFALSTRSERTRPGVVDRDARKLTEQDDKCRSGDYVKASVEFWAMDNQYGQRICATTRWVQFIRLGDRFGGGVPVSESEFEDLSVGDPQADYSNEYA